MKLQNSTLKKNKSSLDINLNNSNMKNSEKIITTRIKKLKIKKTSENSKNISNPNSNSNIKKDKSYSSINGNKFMNIDNINESSYNKELYIIPNQKKEKKKFFTTNIEKAVQIYNEIKEEINNKIMNKSMANKAKNIQMQNYIMVSILEKLNKILDTIVERSKYNQNKNKFKGINIKTNGINIINNKKNHEKKEKLKEKDINEKLLKSYIQQYKLLSSKYAQLTNGDYASNLKKQITNNSEEILKLEKENRELKRTQSRTECLLKNQKISKNELDYKKNLELSEKLNNEMINIKNAIKIKEGEIKSNEERINKLLQNKENLLIKAKDNYNITNPEKSLTEKIPKDEKDTIKYNLYIKRKDLENKNLVVNNNLKKYNIIEKDNKKLFKDLKENEGLISMNLQLKREEIIKLNEILEKVEIENNTFEVLPKSKNIEQNNNINLSQNTIKLKEQNDRYSSITKVTSSPANSIKAKTYNKKIILQQLDAQKKKEDEDLNRISLRKKNLKPNFSFSLNNSSKKDKNEKNVNLSVALVSKSNPELEQKNEPEEIKEDINISPYDEQKATDNNNLSHNISIDIDKKDEINNDNKKKSIEIKEEKRINENINNINNDNELEEEINEQKDIKENDIENNDNMGDEKNRQNALNTLPFYELEKSEKDKNEENKNEEDNNEDGNNEENKSEENKKEENKSEENKSEEKKNEIKHENESKEGNIDLNENEEKEILNKNREKDNEKKENDENEYEENEYEDEIDDNYDFEVGFNENENKGINKYNVEDNHQD